MTSGRVGWSDGGGGGGESASCIWFGHHISHCFYNLPYLELLATHELSPSIVYP